MNTRDHITVPEQFLLLDNIDSGFKQERRCRCTARGQATRPGSSRSVAVVARPEDRRRVLRPFDHKKA
jgi:hypothetical protein